METRKQTKYFRKLVILLLAIFFVSSIPNTSYAAIDPATKKTYEYGNFVFRRYGTKNKLVRVIEYKGKEKKLILPKQLGEYKIVDMLDFGRVQELHIPKNVEVQLSDSKKLKKVTVEEGHSLYIVKNNLLLNATGVRFLSEDQKEGSVLLEAPGGIKVAEVPDSVELIYQAAFSGSNITQLDLGENVSVIENVAFTDNKKLKKINFNKNLKYIASSAFSNCTSLKEIALPEGLKTIELYAFSSCRNLKKITIPDTVKKIGEGAFAGCGVKEITIPQGIKIISQRMFAECTKLKKVTIPDNIKYIGKEAFINCRSLQTITVPDSVKRIERNAFHNCKNLKSIYITNKDCKIGKNPSWCWEAAEGYQTIPKTTTIYGYIDSPAHKYAKRHGNPFVDITKIDVAVPQL